MKTLCNTATHNRYQFCDCLQCNVKSLTFAFSLLSVALNSSQVSKHSSHHVCCHQHPVFCTCCVWTGKQHQKKPKDK